MKQLLTLLFFAFLPLWGFAEGNRGVRVRVNGFTFDELNTGFKNGEVASVLTTQPTFSCSATSSIAPGTDDITPSGAYDRNYSFTYINGTLTTEQMSPSSPAITFADANVKAICVANWDTDGDGELSEAEAAAVTDLGTVFSYNNTITSFDELSYFTGVTSIGYYAFYGCSGLTNITIPEGVTSIGYYAFYGCSGLTNITIPEGVTSIGMGAFQTSYRLTSITIPSTVTSIGPCAFDSCLGLTSITIPNGVTSIGENAFSACTSLTSMTFPSSVTTIPDDVCAWCYSLTSVTIPSSVTSIGDGAFYDCNGLTSVTIPEGVTSIGDGAFYHCSSLTSVTINSDAIMSEYNASSINIGDTFGSQVKEYTIGGNVTSIGYCTFYGCSSLTKVNIGENVTSIGANAFYGCTGLTSITIPSSVTFVGKDAFYGCSGLTKVIVPDIATWCSIFWWNSESNPMYYAKHLYSDENTEITDLTIPEDVTFVGEDAFYGCSSLTSVTIPSSVTGIGGYAFAYCTGLTSMTIPSSVTFIGESAFEGCSNITDLKLNCETIENWFADSKTSLKTLTIGEGTTTISDSAFEGFSVLTTVSLGSNVSNIGANAFAHLSKLEDVYCYAIRYPRVDASTFEDSYVEYVTLHVPEVSLQQYKNHAVWGEFFMVVPLDEPSAITDIEGDGNGLEIEAIYDLNGQRQPALHRGINIIKMSDGTIKKVMVK